MIHKSRAGVDEFRAENIESGNDALYRGLVWAIIHVTRSDLENLDQDYKKAELEKISKNAKIAEAIILAAIEPAMPKDHRGWGMVEVQLSLDLKERLKWKTLQAIQYLYTMRYGEMRWGELNTLLNTNEDEPYAIVIQIDRDVDGKLYISKILLKRLTETSLIDEKSEEPNK